MKIVISNRLAAALTLFLIVLLPLCFSLFSGCASKLEGDINTNQAPIVGFINSPPESTNFSRNAVIYWWGTDPDGLVAYFRYHVAAVEDMGSMTPDVYIQSVQDQDSLWTVIDVDIANSEPGTDDIIKLSADLSDPVNTFVFQYVFLQAFDEEGMASAIVWRIFGRNDNPPQTSLFNPPAADLPFVDAEFAGGIITGVKMRWVAEDPIDYPQDPPPFDFEYRLYGPYDDSLFAEVENRFFTLRFVTADGRVFSLGDTVIRCDTSIIFAQQVTCDTTVDTTITPNDTSVVCDTVTLAPDTTVNCDTLIVTVNTPTNAFGGLEDFFDVDTSDFLSNPLFNSVVFKSENAIDGSPWVQKTADTIFNVYKTYKDTVTADRDTTVEMTFVFWIRSRDDAQVPDIAPAFMPVRVVNPRYEREVLIVDATINTFTFKWTNRRLNDQVAKDFWYEVIKAWAGSDTTKYLDIIRTPGSRHAPDYFQPIKAATKEVPIATLLKHKVAILYDDGIAKPGLDASLPNIYKAIDAGVNVWVTMRSPFAGSKQEPPGFKAPTDLNYARYFGVTAMMYSGWICHALHSNKESCPEMRIEDFIGATPKLPGWPHIAVDKVLLRNRLDWDQAIGVNARLGWFDDQVNWGLPEVDWSVRTFGTELLYKYESFYGAEHPRGDEFTFEAAPVAHRLNAGLYRTVHSNFIPLVLEQVTMQVMVDSILNWLYDPTLGAPTAKIRYDGAKLQISVEEARENYRRRVEEYERLHGDAKSPFYNYSESKK